MGLLSALLVAAQALSVPAPSSRTCLAVQVADPGQEGVRRQRSFSARETLALELRTWLHPRLSGDHTVRLKLFVPVEDVWAGLLIAHNQTRVDSIGRDQLLQRGVAGPERVVVGFDAGRYPVHRAVRSVPITMTSSGSTAHRQN